MKHFVGTKVLKARPMTLGQYNDYRFWEMPAAEDAVAEGYLVEYTDGGKPNHPNHSGYISWSPKEQFDAAYVEMGDYLFDHLPPHVIRLIAERAELTNRLDKLNHFINLQTAHHTDDEDLDPQLREAIRHVPKVPHADWKLLVEQFIIMRNFQSILDRRIARATAATGTIAELTA